MFNFITRFFKTPYYHFVAEVVQDGEVVLVADGCAKFNKHLENCDEGFYPQIREHVRDSFKDDDDIEGDYVINIVRLQRL